MTINTLHMHAISILQERIDSKEAYLSVYKDELDEGYIKGKEQQMEELARSIKVLEHHTELNTREDWEKDLDAQLQDSYNKALVSLFNCTQSLIKDLPKTIKIKKKKKSKKIDPTPSMSDEELDKVYEVLESIGIYRDDAEVDPTDE